MLSSYSIFSAYHQMQKMQKPKPYGTLGTGGSNAMWGPAQGGMSENGGKPMASGASAFDTLGSLGMVGTISSLSPERAAQRVSESFAWGTSKMGGAPMASLLNPGNRSLGIVSHTPQGGALIIDKAKPMAIGQSKLIDKAAYKPVQMKGLT